VLGENVAESIELSLDQAAPRGHPVGQRRKAAWLDLTRSYSPHLDAADESALLEHADVLRDRGKREVERLGQLAHARRPAAEPFDQCPARRIGERAKAQVERIMLKHRLEYRRVSQIVKSSLEHSRQAEYSPDRWPAVASARQWGSLLRQDALMPMTPTQAREALERCEPRMPVGEVHEWAERFGSDGEDDRVIDAIAPKVRERGHFLRQEFLDTYAWKTRRTLGRAEQYSEAEIADVTRVAFRQTNEKLRIGLLRALDGVDWPVASTLLHVGVSSDYPILDFRALWALGSTMPSSVSFEFWWAYVQCCRRLAAEAGVTVRELDKALWAYSDAHQPRGTR
jgi:hypothetical protein